MEFLKRFCVFSGVNHFSTIILFLINISLIIVKFNKLEKVFYFHFFNEYFYFGIRFYHQGRLRLEFLNISLKVINSMFNYISMLNFLFIQIIAFEIIFLFYFKDYNYGKVVFIVKISSLIIVCYALFFVNLFLETFICLIINFIIEACLLNYFIIII
jgi:hypothetical protein